MIRFCRSLDAQDVLVLDIRSTAEHPYCCLSFDYQHGQIPVPGLRGNYGESVTGIFEALRLIGPIGKPGRINYGYFAGPGRERSCRMGEWMTGWSYYGRCVDIFEARRQILIPAYRWVLENKAAAACFKVRKLASQRAIGLYDGHESANIRAPERLSAAAILTAYLDDRLDLFLDGKFVLDD